jgi:hypothetical protein
MMSELPLRAPGGSRSVRKRKVGRATSSGKRSLRAVDQSQLTPIHASDTPVSEHSIAGLPGDGAADPEPAASSYRDDALLTVADAARLARRSVRTLRRAYLTGKLTAHRDGNGRGVSICYRDLRDWLTAYVIAPAPAAAPSRAVPQAVVRGQIAAGVSTGNDELLTAALERQGKRARAAARPRRQGSRR